MSTGFQSSFSRRRFLQGGAATLGFPSLTRALGNNAKLQHASIGVGGMGAGDISAIAGHDKVEIVAICDVDAATLDAQAKKFPNARRYSDWRELFQNESDKIDSVNVAVPDHMHAAIAMSAIRGGKHVYLQKPMCHDVAEVRALTNAAREKNVITQLGTQWASEPGDRTALAWIKQGHIGKIKHVYVGSNRPGAGKYRLRGPRPEKGEPPPANLNWDLWIGTAPMRDFAPHVYHPGRWRTWQDFGTGWSGDIGCHILDAVWRILEPSAPRTIVAEVQESWQNDPRRRRDVWPQCDHITWTFEGTPSSASQEITVEWFDGDVDKGKDPVIEGDRFAFYPPKEVQKLWPGENFPSEFAAFIGEEGTLILPHTSGPLLVPRDKFKQVKRPELPRRGNHYHHWLNAIVGTEKNESHFDHAGPMSETVLLGTVALRCPGQLLQWDAINMKFPNYPDAEKFLRRTYRESWRTEGLG
ncbi:MAG: Gfo/Idh/MocA family protein [Verrucomicrobiales bacterium]